MNTKQICTTMTVLFLSLAASASAAAHEPTDTKRVTVGGMSGQDDYRIVCLQNVSEESKISEIKRVFFIEDKILVYDRYRLLIFDTEGRFLKSDKQVWGENRQKYTEGFVGKQDVVQFIHDVALDEGVQELYLYTTDPSKITVTDVNLNYKRTLNLNLKSGETCAEICISGDYVYALLKSHPQQDYFKIVSYSKKSLNTDAINATSTTLVTWDKLIGIGTMGRFLNVNSDVYASVPYSNKIYCLKKGQVEREWNIRLDDWVDYENFKHIQAHIKSSVAI